MEKLLSITSFLAIVTMSYTNVYSNPQSIDPCNTCPDTNWKLQVAELGNIYEVFENSGTVIMNQYNFHIVGSNQFLYNYVLFSYNWDLNSDCIFYEEGENSCGQHQPKVRWSGLKQDGITSLINSPFHAPNGGFNTILLKVDQPGLYTFNALHLGWNSCGLTCAQPIEKTFELTVEDPLSVAQHGADIGNALEWSNVPDGSYLEHRMQAMKDDGFSPVIRLFAHDFNVGGIKWYIRAIKKAHAEGIKVLLIFPCSGTTGDTFYPSTEEWSGPGAIEKWWHFNPDVRDFQGNFLFSPFKNTSTNRANATHFANFVEDRLYAIENGVYSGIVEIESGLPGAIGDTIVAIGIGNEEEGKWYNGTVYGELPTNYGLPASYKPDFWYGDPDEGAIFARYYIEAANRIKARWGDRDVKLMSGGSLEKHGRFSYDSSEFGRPFNEKDGSPTEFLKGFINEVVATDETLLPDILDFHTYSGFYNPEYHSISDETPLFGRLDELRTAINSAKPDFKPEFSITEYGFSPRKADPTANPPVPQMERAPLPKRILSDDEIDPSQETQAIYYLRATLMHSTLLSVENDRITYDTYWQYVRNDTYNPADEPDPDISGDTGFFNDNPAGGEPAPPNYNLGTSRSIIRDIANRIFSQEIEPIIGLGDTETTIWIPAQSSNPLVEVEFIAEAWCGWARNNGERWAAFWQYSPRQQYYRPTSGAVKNFKISGDFDTYYTHEMYHFSGYPVVFTPSSNFSVTLDSNNDTVVTINTLADNPVFIRFIPQ